MSQPDAPPPLLAFCSPYQGAYAFQPLMDMMAVANRRP